MALQFRLLGALLFFSAAATAGPTHAIGNIFKPLATPAELVSDVIPNRTNRMWIDPKEAGVYLGNCSEYCGTQHAKMELRVVVDTPEDFEKWVAQQQQRAPAAESVDNQRAFLRAGCIACHTVTGTPALGRLGPDLTHMMSRETIAATEVPMNATTLRDWIKDPQRLKPGNKMPTIKVSDTQLDQMVAYLTTLH